MIDLASLPVHSGCYLFKDESKKVIYIGKAKNLRKRVKSYFQKKGVDPKTKSLLENIDSVDFFVTDNDVEALILENNLIKKHQPKYNIDLKDSKNYAYLHLTEEAFPRLLIARKKVGKGRFFGPFVSASQRDHVRFVLNNSRISKIDYNSRVQKVKLILKGRTKQLIKELEQEMALASGGMNFEKALEIRNQITSLNRLSQEQKVDRQKSHDEVIINFIVRGGKVYLLLFNIYKGTLGTKEEFSFDYSLDFFEEFLVQYYSENNVPKELILPKKVDASVKEFLEVKKGSRVEITIPKRGAKKQLLELVKKNIEITFFGDLSKLDELRDALGLEERPVVIECFDISHLSGTSTVGSMVQFRDARPDKNNYRRFKIKTVEGIADTAAIGEVVRRRYYRLKKEGSRLPNLIIIDGGAGQLNAALKALQALELKVPVIAVAKRFEDIYLPGHVLPIKLDRNDRALRFIQEIRDEAHRFAIKYHKLLRAKEFIR
jgi:excinuclease ABC subunit C